MSRVPDAWDDNWDTPAAVSSLRDFEKHTTNDSQTNNTPPNFEPLTRAERRARHAEANRQLWADADRPQQFFLQTQNNVPLKSDFKPAIQVLGRKSKPVNANGVKGLSIADEDDSEEEARKANEASLLQRQLKAKAERADRQRKYNEVRARLFGESGGSSNTTALSGSSTSIAKLDLSVGTTGKNTGCRTQSPSEPSPRRGQNQRSKRGAQQSSANLSHASSTAEQSPARAPSAAQRRLYDPMDNSQARPARPGRRTSAAETVKVIKPSREPRGPTECGPHGNGFDHDAPSG